MKGFIKPSVVKIWHQRGEVYVGLLDGVINIYAFALNMEVLSLSASFKMHQEAIHNIYIYEDLGYAVSSGFDSCLKVWKPPERWERKMVIMQSLVQGMDPKEDLETIKEVHETQESHLIKRRISGLEEILGKVDEEDLQGHGIHYKHSTFNVNDLPPGTPISPHGFNLNLK